MDNFPIAQFIAGPIRRRTQHLPRSIRRRAGCRTPRTAADVLQVQMVNTHHGTPKTPSTRHIARGLTCAVAERHVSAPFPHQRRKTLERRE
ncbi:MAG: hypothetical protein LBH74_01130 [Nitrososphaerota archaeon]|nr:hypothetical protein [Nitrososphaerota archaeon]